MTRVPRIPSSFTGPVFLSDSYTRERILLAKQKSTQEVWIFHENRENWMPWRCLGTDEILNYYEGAPRLRLVITEKNATEASV